MSRIEQALRRAGMEAVACTPATTEAAFSPAWPVDAAEPGQQDSDDAGNRQSAALLWEERSTAIRGFSSAWRERLATGPDADPVLVEQFRRLAGTLHQAQVANGIRTVMVTSAAPEDGKTLTAVNLAVVMSESYQRRVLLVDADLRRPSIGNIADVTTALGLTEALRAKTEQKLAVIQITPTLTLLPAGRPDPDPLSGLTSPRMRRILEEAVTRFDWVVLDAPPVGPMADANLLAEMVDGALLVLRAGRTPYAAVKTAIDALGRERILGVVLNGVQQLPTGHYERYYAPSRPHRDPMSRARIEA